MRPFALVWPLWSMALSDALGESNTSRTSEKLSVNAIEVDNVAASSIIPLL